MKKPDPANQFLADAFALKHKYRMSDAEYAGAVAGWFLALCNAVGRDPVADLQTAIDACRDLESP